MPIDPNLAQAILNPPKFKTPDPMEQMGGALTNALMMDKLQTAQEGRSRNALINKVLGPAYKNGKLDQNLGRQAIADAGLAASIPELEESWVKGDKAQAETDKIHTEALIKSLEFTRQYLPAAKTPQDYTQLMFNDSVIGPQLTKQFGGPEKLLAVLNQMSPEQFAKLKEDQMAGVENTLKNHYQLVQEKDQQRLVAAPEYGSGAPRTVGTYGPKPVNPGTTINMPGAKTYAETVAEETAKRDVAAGATVAALPNVFADLDTLENLVDKAFTGYWANGKYTMSAATGVNPEAVNATQQMNQLLSTDMLKNIGTLRNQYDVKLGSVTEKEFDQLRKTTPSMTDSPATIKAWAKKARDIAQRTLDDYKRLKVDREKNPLTSGVSSLLPGSGSQPPAIPSAPNPPEPPTTPWVQGMKGTNGRPISQKQYEAFIKDRDIEEFDEHFGKGSAVKVLGGAPNGGRPFP